MGKGKVLVVEDEIIIADNICDALKDLGYEVLEPAINYTEAIASIKKETPDIAILDIQLSGKKTGIDIAKIIRASYSFPFIFLTSNSDNLTLNLAKEVMPPAYLIKPFSKQELYTSIEIALHNFSKNVAEKSAKIKNKKKSIFIKDKGYLTKIYLEDILYLKSDHVYIEIVLKSNQKIVTRSGLSEFLNKLDDTFIRIHRGYIINTKYLTQLSQNSLQVSNIELPIGKKYKEEIIKKINTI